mmetsp:Transcript_69327/g.96162  ORF Transcript_69327/g.96162 Transcript_69327/m.96162 type:complete len:366 (-) Transcript_69327:5-1102(-)
MLRARPSPGVVRLRGEGAAAALDNHRGSVGTCLAAVRNRQALHQAGQEAAHVRVAGAVRVHKLLLGQHEDRVLLDHATDAHDGGVAALRDDHGALAVLCAGDQGEPRGDELDVLGLPALSLSPGQCLRLVAEEVVHVGHGLVEDGLEGRHLHEEGRGEVHAVDALGLLLLRGQLDGLRRHGREEASTVDDLCVLHDLPVLWLLAVRGLVVVRGVQVRAQRPLNAHNERGAGARGRGLVHHVRRLHAVVRARLREGLAIRVLADAAHVGSGAGLLQHPLGHANGVLRCAARDVLHVGLLRHLPEERLVLLLRQDRVAALQPVLVEHVLAHLRGDVQQRVAHAKESRHLLQGVGGLRSAQGAQQQRA